MGGGKPPQAKAAWELAGSPDGVAMPNRRARSNAASHSHSGIVCLSMAKPELIPTKYLDGTPVAWKCSQCDQGFNLPEGRYVTTRQIERDFEWHCEMEHAPNR